MENTTAKENGCAGHPDQKTGKKRIWKEYQKEIPADKYFYVRSCIRQNFFPASEAMFLKILREDLGKDIFENPHHTTCSGIGYHSDVIPMETTMTIVARQFALMAEAGYENLAVSCITSFGIYSEFIETWKHFPQVREKIADNLRRATGRELVLPKCVAHASDIIYRLKDEIAERAKYRLVNKLTGEPLKIVEHIGCHYAKMFPSKGVGGAEYPCVLSGMAEAWGGQVID